MKTTITLITLLLLTGTLASHAHAEDRYSGVT